MVIGQSSRSHGFFCFYVYMMLPAATRGQQYLMYTHVYMQTYVETDIHRHTKTKRYRQTHCERLTQTQTSTKDSGTTYMRPSTQLPRVVGANSELGPSEQWALKPSAAREPARGTRHFLAVSDV